MRRSASYNMVLTKIQDDLQTISSLLTDLQGSLKLVDDLLAAGEKRRLGRVNAIGVGELKVDALRVTAPVRGTSGNYETRITFAPHRGHHCTCEDWARNGKRVGPCKHVLALGMAWRDQRLVPEMLDLQANVQKVLTSYT